MKFAYGGAKKPPDMSEKERREVILDLIRRGKTPAQIKDATGACYKTIRKLRQSGSADRAPRQFNRPKRTPDLVRRVRQSIEKQPRQSLNKLAQKNSVSDRTVRRVVKDLGYRSYARTPAHKITPAGKAQRLKKAQNLLNKIKHEDAGKAILFSDEKYFTLAQYSNQRNDQIVVRQGEIDNIRDDLRHVQHQQRATGIMFLGVISSDGKIAPPIFVPSGVKINADEYVGILRRHLKPWIDANYPNPASYVFQQDGASAHTAKKTQEYLHQEGWSFWDKSVWPASSPDLAPLDYSIWDKVAGVACREEAPNLQTLRRRVARAWRQLEPDYIRSTCRAFQTRLEAVISGGGGRIE